MNLWTHLFTFWKWPTWFVESTRWAALPKKVWTPVAITTASISPCLHVEPEYTLSPGPLVTGSDSPVRADCKLDQETRLSHLKNNEASIKIKKKKKTRNSYSITWSIFRGSPSRRRASAGIISPSLMLIISPGTRTDASSSIHFPSLRTCSGEHINDKIFFIRSIDHSMDNEKWKWLHLK